MWLPTNVCHWRTVNKAIACADKKWLCSPVLGFAACRGNGMETKNLTAQARDMGIRLQLVIAVMNKLPMY